MENPQLNDSWLPSIISAVMAILLITLIIMIGVNIYRKRNPAVKMDLSDYIGRDFKYNIEMFAVFSTITEVLNLTMMAVNRNMDFTAAFTRYFIFGVLEIVFTFSALSIGIKYIKTLGVAFYNKQWHKFIIQVFVVGPCMIVLLIATSLPSVILLLFYLESIDLLNLIWLGNLNPFSMFTYELKGITEEGFISIDSNYNHPELVVVMLIAFNPILNVIVFIYSFGEYFKPNNESVDKAVTSTTAIVKTFSSDREELNGLIERFIAITGNTATRDKVQEKLYSSDKTKLHNDIVNGVKTVQQMEQDWIKVLKNPINEHDSYKAQIDKAKAEASALARDITAARNEVNAATGTAKTTAEAKLNKLLADKSAKDKDINDWTVKKNEMKSKITKFATTIDIF